jgi:hypothetical protein
VRYPSVQTALFFFSANGATLGKQGLISFLSFPLFIFYSFSALFRLCRLLLLELSMYVYFTNPSICKRILSLAMAVGGPSAAGPYYGSLLCLSRQNVHLLILYSLNHTNCTSHNQWRSLKSSTCQPSVFDMNFPRFRQDSLGISLWVAVNVPYLRCVTS